MGVKQFDWNSLLVEHPVFWDLEEAEIESLLEEKTSKERTYAAGQAIIREGEEGNSVFLVGDGEVSIILGHETGTGPPIATLGRGEFFGEMAALENRARVATVLAKTPATLLEIPGETFKDFLQKHPEIEFKVAVKLSQRLRDVTEHVLSARFLDVDQKLQLFNTKLESELRVIDASMKATQAVFDQTNKRANEIIQAAERSRGRLTTTVSVAGGVIGVFLAGLGFFGIEKANTISDALEKYETFETQVSQFEEMSTGLSTEVTKVNELSQQIERAAENFRVLQKDVQLRFTIPNVREDLLNNPERARLTFAQIMAADDPQLTVAMYKTVFGGLFSTEAVNEELLVRDDYIDLLEYAIRRQNLTERQNLIAFYLLLSTLAMIGHERFEFHFPAYEEAVNDYDGASLRELIAAEFDTESFRQFLPFELNRASIEDDDVLSARRDRISDVWDLVP